MKSTLKLHLQLKGGGGGHNTLLTYKIRLKTLNTWLKTNLYSPKGGYHRRMAPPPKYATVYIYIYMKVEQKLYKTLIFNA